MPYLPNRYFNSPYIADAAQNLAHVLAPPDKKEQLALEEAQWKFNREKQLAGIQDQQRVEQTAAYESLGALLANASKTQVTPTSPGHAAYLSEHPEAAGSAGLDPDAFAQHVNTALRGRIPLEAVDYAAGPKGPGYLAKKDLLTVKGDQAAGLLNTKLAQQMMIFERTETGRMLRASMNDDRLREMGFDANQIAMIRIMAENDRAAAHEKGLTERGGDKVPLDVSPTEGRNMGYNIEDYFSNLVGNTLDDQPYKLPGDVLNAVSDYAGYLYPKTRNSKVAEQQAREFFFGPNPRVTKADAPYFGWNTEASVALRDGKTLDELLKELQLLKSQPPAQMSSVVAPGADAATSGTTATTPAGTNGVPAGIARPTEGMPGEDTPPVIVRSVEEAMLLPGNTKFMINGGPRNGEVHWTPAR